MNKTNKVLTIGLILGIVLTFGIFGVKAFGDTKMVCENGATCYFQEAISTVMEAVGLGGSTSADWNVGGNLAVTGTTALTGETKLSKTHTGGTVTDASSTMNTALTLTAAQVCDSSVIHVNSSSVAGDIIAASLDITFPATSTLFADCLDDDGDTTSFVFYNSSPTAATTTQMVAGAGGKIFEPDGQNVEIGGLNGALITLQRNDDFETNESVMIFIDENIPG